MMKPSNISYTSNVYPIKESFYSDKVFIGHVYNYQKLKELKKKYFNTLGCNLLTPLQEKIICEGSTCTSAKGDPCWGMIVEDNEIKWVCKCVNKNCLSFTKCRSDFEEEEYALFSPYANRNGIEYEYAKLEKQDYYEFEIRIGDSVTYTYDFDDELKKSQRDKKVIPSPMEVIDAIGILELEESEDELEPDWEEVQELGTEYTPPKLPDQIQISTTPIYDLPNNLTVPTNIFDSFKFVNQDDIIMADPGKNIFVDAGPGTGKTYTLIKKIDYLVSELGIDPQNIQVLSFTNAAVIEIKNRLNDFVREGGDRGLRNVDVRTFHSMAWMMLSYANEHYVNRGWHNYGLFYNEGSYDESVLKATELTKRYSDIISGWQHFLVDEVQDLTGAKAEFVLSLVEACIKEGCGFTALGDSCQAIYDYEQDNKFNALTSEIFYRKLYQIVMRNGFFWKLEENHRQIDDLIILTEDFRSSILKQNVLHIKDSVKEMSHKLKSISDDGLRINEKLLDELCGDKTICLLCRNNGQTLNLSTTFHKMRIGHVLNMYETKENFAPWISQVFIDCAEATIDFAYLKNSFARKGIQIQGYSEEDVWERIKDLMHKKNEIIDVSNLLESIRTSKIDDPLFRVSCKSKIIVSNIHRAKGREYESVVIDNTFINELQNKVCDIAEYKVLYVAATRPKSSINKAKLSNPWEVKLYSIFGTKRKRWLHKTENRLSHFEVAHEMDVDKITFLNRLSNDVQDYILKIQPGDEIKLRRIISDGNLSYDIVHCTDEKEANIGKINQIFINDLKAIVKPKASIYMPVCIENLYVESVYTSIQGHEYGRLFPEVVQKSKNCIWNWVAFRGLGHLVYDTY